MPTAMFTSFHCGNSKIRARLETHEGDTEGGYMRFEAASLADGGSCFTVHVGTRAQVEVIAAACAEALNTFDFAKEEGPSDGT